MSVGQVTRINGLMSTYSVGQSDLQSLRAPVPRVSKISGEAEPRGGTLDTTLDSMVLNNTATGTLTGRNGGTLAGIYYSSDGDSAEISNMAMNMFLDLEGGSGILPQLADYNLALPQPADYNQALPQPADYNQALPQPADYNQTLPQPADNYQAVPQPADYNQPQPQTADYNQPQPQPADNYQALPQPEGYNYFALPGPLVANNEQPNTSQNTRKPEYKVTEELLRKLEPKGFCQTCANRRYVDQSSDPSVSFQTPTKISAGRSAVAVAAHENEHVYNERASAERNNRRVIHQSVSLTYACCPECGASYVSGGTTRTTSVGKSDNTNYNTVDAEPSNASSAT